MSFIEHCWEHFNVFALLTLLAVLIICHVFMMHFNRPHDMITWLENLIGGVVGALLMQLGGALKREDKP